MKAFIQNAWRAGVAHGVAPASWLSATQLQLLRRLLSFAQFRREGETVCCASHVVSEPSSSVCLRLSVSMGPAVA